MRFTTVLRTGGNAIYKYIPNKIVIFLPSIMAWGKHCESVGRLREACDPQFSSGHFRSFHLIVVLPKLFVHFICRLWFSSVGFDCRASDASLPNFLTPMLKMWLGTWFWCGAGVSRWIDGNLSETELRVKRKGLVAILLDAPPLPDIISNCDNSISPRSKNQLILTR